MLLLEKGQSQIESPKLFHSNNDIDLAVFTVSDHFLKYLFLARVQCNFALGVLSVD